MWYGGLAVEYSAGIAQFANHFAFEHALFAGSAPAFEGPDPAYVAHGRFDVFHVELVFQTHGEAVKRAGGLLVLSEVGVELFGVGDGGVEEDFVETGSLKVLAWSSTVRWGDEIRVGGLVLLYGRRPWSLLRRSIARRRYA